MKFKVGDKIVPKNGEWDCITARGQDADYAIVTTLTDGEYYYDLYKGSEKMGCCSVCQDDTNSKLMEKTMENIQKGDVIVSDGERTVIERLGDIVFTTGCDNDWSMTLVWSTTELKNKGFTIKQPEPEPTELTMQEVADKFGIDVSKLKIKKG